MKRESSILEPPTDKRPKTYPIYETLNRRLAKTFSVQVWRTAFNSTTLGTQWPTVIKDVLHVLAIELENFNIPGSSLLPPDISSYVDSLNSAQLQGWQLAIQSAIDSDDWASLIPHCM